MNALHRATLRFSYLTAILCVGGVAARAASPNALPTVSITAPTDQFSTSENTAEVTVSFNANNGNVQTVILRRDGAEVGNYANPPSVKTGTVTFTVDLSALGDSQITLQAEAYQGAQQAGLVGYSNPVRVLIDRTAPTIAPLITPAVNSNGWHNANVTIHFDATDTGSGVASVTDDIVVTQEGAAQVFSGVAVDRVGNSNSVAVTINLDKTAPELDAIPSSVANSNGWNNTAITVHFDAADALSGVDTVSPDVTVTDDGTGQIVTGSATDKAGNTAHVSLTVNLDQASPTITATPVPAPNLHGWNNTDVLVEFDAYDNGAGIAFLSPDITVSAEGAGQLVEGEVMDYAGNFATASATVSIDKTLPTITGTVAPAANAAGWHRTNPTVTFTATDALSGIDVVTEPVEIVSEGAGQSVVGSATDKAGNSASTTLSINLDKTPPALNAVINPLPNSNGWHNAAVTVSFIATDALSGVAAVSPDAVVATEGANQVLAGAATDVAGNEATAQSPPINLDKTPPVVTLTVTPAPNAAGWHNTDPTITFSAADGLSGVNTVTSPVTVNTEGAGQVVSGMATDSAGNTGNNATIVHVDKTAPTVSLSPADGVTINKKQPQLVIQYGDNVSGVASIQILVDGVDKTTAFDLFTDGASATLGDEFTDGSHTWQVTLADAAGNSATASASFTVSTDAAITAFRGRVHRMDDTPLPGVTIRLPGVSTTTGADGWFTVSAVAGRRLLEVDGRPLGYAYIAELIDIEPGLNVMSRPIYLPLVPLETAGIQVSQTDAITLTNPDVPGVSVTIAAGSIKNPDGTVYTGKLMLLQVPLDRTPLALPPDLEPDLVVAVQPGGMQFTTPALLTMPNTAGYPDGALLDLWSLNPNTGVFEVVGRCQVQGNSIVTISGGMIASAWHFPLPGAPSLSVGSPPYNLPPNDCPVSVSSAISLVSGDLSEGHTLPAVQFLGRSFAPRLLYHSATAHPRVVAKVDADYSGTIKPQTSRDLITVAGVQSEGPVRSVAPTGGSKFRYATEINLAHVRSGVVNVDYATRGSYGNAAVTGRATLPVVVNNQGDSASGAGWTLDLPLVGGLQRLLADAGGNFVTIQEGAGTSRLFVRGQAPVLQCMGDQVWLVASGSVQVFDARSLTLLKRIPVPSATLTLAVDPLHRKAYLLTGAGFSVSLWEIDADDFAVRTGPVVGSTTAGGSPRGRKMVVSAFGQVLVRTGFPNGLLAFSTESLAPELFIDRTQLGYSSLWDLQASADQRTAWIIGLNSFSSAGVSEIDLQTLTVRRQFSVMLPMATAANSTLNELYILGTDDSFRAQLSVFDLGTGATKRQILFPAYNALTWPMGWLISAGADAHVYVNLSSSINGLGSILHLVDVEAGTVLNPQLATGLRAIESVAGDTRLFAMAGTGSSLQLLDGGTGIILGATDLSGIFTLSPIFLAGR